MTTPRRHAPLLLVAPFAAALLLGACSGAGEPSANPTTSATVSPPAGSAEPASGSSTGSSNTGSGTDPGSAAGGGSAGDPGTGVGVEPPPNPTPVDPAAGQPLIVRPQPGQADLHPVAPIALQASIDGRHVLVKVSWYGGIEPCAVLDSVKVDRSGTDIALTLFEGSSDRTAVCPELAVLKATIVDLGELDPGTWRISSPGSKAPPIVLTID